MFQTKINTPIGKMKLTSNDEILLEARILFEEVEVEELLNPILQETIQQLEAYFSGERQDFDIPISMRGTDFQNKVWQVLNEIPYGQYLTYKEIAEQTGSPKAFRAVGGACRANPYPVIIPCHRVLSTSGALTGYAGDKTYVKKWLLDFEQKKELR